MTGNCYINKNYDSELLINRTQITQELGQGIATSTEHKKHNKNYDRELLHQQNTITQQELGQGIATSTTQKTQ